MRVGQRVDRTHQATDYFAGDNADLLEPRVLPSNFTERGARIHGAAATITLGCDFRRWVDRLGRDCRVGEITALAKALSTASSATRVSALPLKH